MRRDGEIRYLEILSVISAIMGVGNTIASVISGSESSNNSSNLNKLLDALHDLLMPHHKEDLRSRTEKYKKLLIEEHNRGPLQVRALDDGSKKRRRRRKRKCHNTETDRPN